jgi:regulator of sigma E protease
LSYVLAFLGFSALIILHELGHFIAAKAVGMRVERFALFFPPLLVKVRRGETEYGIGAIPLGGFVRISGMTPHEQLPPEVAHRAYYRQAVWKRIVVIAAGPAMNLLIAFLILWALFVFVGRGVTTSQVDRVERGYPAAQVLRSGDRLVSVDGVRGDPTALGAQIASHRCEHRPTKGCQAATPARLVVVRDGRRLALQARPQYDPTQGRTRLGFGFGVRVEHPGPLLGAGRSASEMWHVTTATVSAIGRLFYSEQARKDVSGVVGSYEATRQSFQFDTVRALFLLAVISLSLAVVNLFPFLPLDGGHIFWALAEKLRGRPIPFRVLERASVVGFMLVAFLFIVGLTNDIGRLQGQGFGVR